MKNDYKMTTDLRILEEYLGTATAIAFDFETAANPLWAHEKEAALDAHKAHIVGISLAVAEHSGIYVPLRHVNGANAAPLKVMAWLRQRVFENPAVTKIVHNLSFEARFLLAQGITLVPPVYDTIAGAQLMLKDEQHFRGLRDAGLKGLAYEWCSLWLPSYGETVGTGSFRDLDPADDATIAYACGDADLALRCYRIENAWFAQNIPAHEALVRTIESPVALFTALMEHRGVLVDREGLQAAADAGGAQLQSCRQRLENSGSRPVRVGENAATNDVKAYLFNDLALPVLKATETGKPSVDGEAISLLLAHCREDHPEHLDFLGGIRDYRGLAKLIKTYILGLQQRINPVTLAIHTRFFPLGAETGRFSSQNPNCQNLPAGASHGVNVRDFFTARPGCTLVSVDYSQIELRVGAWFTGDPNMLGVFVDGGDIHALTTAAVYGITLSEARDKSHPDYKERRAVAKNINFGIFYGLYPRGLKRILAQKAGIDRSEAQCAAMIAAIHQAYPKLAAWQDEVKWNARYRETVDTALGRRRSLYGINGPDENTRAHFERAALNHPIQGTAADILKLAMVRLYAGLAERPYIHPLLTVHDEIVFEVATERLAEAVAWIRGVMEAPPFASFDVPLVAEAAVGPTYGSLKPWAPAENRTDQL